MTARAGIFHNQSLKWGFICPFLYENLVDSCIRPQGQTCPFCAVLLSVLLLKLDFVLLTHALRSGVSRF